MYDLREVMFQDEERMILRGFSFYLEEQGATYN